MKRSVEESKEALDQINNNAPGAKFQQDQQVQNTDDAKLATGGDDSFVVKRRKTPGSELKQEVVAKTIKDASYGGSNAGDGLNAAGRSVSGDAGGVLGAANMTPKADRSRNDSRYGKKLDRNSTKLNYIPNEQVLEEYDESKPLAESAELDQGFNGTYRNEFGRSQKVMGNVPAELMFSRSLDLIDKDVLYFPQGQYVRQTGVTYSETPTRSMVLDNKGEYKYDLSGGPNYSINRGDYLNRALLMGFDADGQMRYFGVDTRDITPEVDADGANKSSAAALIARNRDELNRETIDTKAGDEKADIWSPLARAVYEPTAVVGFLRDLEAMTGAEIATAYKKASTSMSFQLNRAHKDGQNLTGPAFDAFRGFYKSANNGSEISTAGEDMEHLFRSSEYVKGSAAIMIAGYDTTRKYNTKADVLIQPRGLRMHLQTADNNIDPFRVPKEFISIYDNQEVFSTIDREYDPLLPICMTDRCALVSRLPYDKLYAWMCNDLLLKYESGAPYDANQKITVVPAGVARSFEGLYLHLVFEDEGVQTDPTIDSTTGVITVNNNVEKDIEFLFDYDSTYTKQGYNVVNIAVDDYHDIGIYLNTATKFGKFTIASGAGKLTPTNAGAFRYGYSDLRNNYSVLATFPLLEGIERYLNDSGRGILNVYTKDAFVGTNSSASDYKKCAAWYKDAYSISMIHSTKTFSLWSFIVCAATPFIMTSRINSMRDVLYYEKNVEYPFPELVPIKDMTTRGYSNFVYTDYDHELETKVMSPATALKWIMPELWTKVGADGSNTYVLAPWYMNENNFTVTTDSGGTDHFEIAEDKSNMSMPSIRSGAKLASLDTLYGMTEKDIRLSMDIISTLKPLMKNTYKFDDTPAKNGTYKYGRMTDGIPYLAFKSSQVNILDVISLPREVGYALDAPYGLLTPNVGDAALTDPSSVYIPHGTSHRATYWLGGTAVRFTPAGGQAILDANGVNVNRAANFKQEWYCMYANGKQATFDHGMVMSANILYENDGDAVTGASLFTPFVKASDGTVATSAGLVQFSSLMKALWTRIQKLPFVISPFDALATDSTRTIAVDLFDLAYWFGLCGFRASDYRESVYNREKQVINQGIAFVSDPWLISSPCFKEGSVSSGNSITVGYKF